MLPRSIDQDLPIAVVEVDGLIVAADRMESRGCRYARWGNLLVHPDHRGRGYLIALVPVLRDIRRESGLGAVGDAAKSIRVARRRVARGWRHDHWCARHPV